jgi:hypothetical protein
MSDKNDMRPGGEGLASALPGPADGGVPDLRWPHWCAIALIAAGSLLVAVSGFANSFAKVEAAMEPSFGRLAWTVPLTIDVAIVVFTALDLLLTWLRMRIWWLRFAAWFLVLATIFVVINITVDIVQAYIDPRMRR